MTRGPIMIVEDDSDDQEIYAAAIQAIGVENEVLFFDTAVSALSFLSTTEEQPFIILSDVNMPQMTGLQFKEKIEQEDYLREKAIPFIFISTNASSAAVRAAHSLGVQGYFQKPHTMDDIKDMLRKLFDYWELSKHVNNI